MSDLFWLMDEQMERLRPFFPKSHGKSRVDDRRVLSSIIFVNRNGLRWHDTPPGIWSTQDALPPLEALERHGHFHTDDGWPVCCEIRTSDHYD